MGVTEDRVKKKLPFTEGQSDGNWNNAQKSALRNRECSQNDKLLCLSCHGSRLEIERLSSVQGKDREIVKR